MYCLVFCAGSCESVLIHKEIPVASILDDADFRFATSPTLIVFTKMLQTHKNLLPLTLYLMYKVMELEYFLEDPVKQQQYKLRNKVPNKVCCKYSTWDENARIFHDFSRTGQHNYQRARVEILT